MDQAIDSMTDRFVNVLSTEDISMEETPMVFDGDCEVSSVIRGLTGLSLFEIPENVSVLSPDIKDYLLAQNSLMHFPAKCSGVQTDILIDSGASREFADKTWCTKHGFHFTPLASPFSVALADGKKSVCSHYIKNVKCKFKQFSHVCDLYVLDLAEEHSVIFGQSFLRKRNPDINWRDQTMTLRKKHKSSSSEEVESLTHISAVESKVIAGTSILDKAKVLKESVEKFDKEILSIMKCAESEDNKEHLDKLISEHHERYSELYDEDFLDYKRF